MLILTLFSVKGLATTYLTPAQAKEAIWSQTALTPANITLTPVQMKAISKASKTRVRNKRIRAWRTPHGGWFILDQIIGKHENIDIALGITHDGKIKDVEILEYRETYGGEVRHTAWLAQFFGRTSEKVLKLDRDIKNISGATLSCRHVTDGVNRWLHTWEQVLQHR